MRINCGTILDDILSEMPFYGSDYLDASSRKITLDSGSCYILYRVCGTSKISIVGYRNTGTASYPSVNFRGSSFSVTADVDNYFTISFFLYLIFIYFVQGNGKFYTFP